MFVKGKSRTIFFPADTLIYGIYRNGSKDFNTHTCEHMILGQLTMGAHQMKNAPLISVYHYDEILHFVFAPSSFAARHH